MLCTADEVYDYCVWWIIYGDENEGSLGEVLASSIQRLKEWDNYGMKEMSCLWMVEWPPDVEVRRTTFISVAHTITQSVMYKNAIKERRRQYVVITGQTVQNNRPHYSVVAKMRIKIKTEYEPCIVCSLTTPVLTRVFLFKLQKLTVAFGENWIPSLLSPCSLVQK